jgi:lysophospholipase L1-like esterase
MSKEGRPVRSRLLAGLRSAAVPAVLAVALWVTGHRHLPLVLFGVSLAVLAAWAAAPGLMGAIEGFVLRTTGRILGVVVITVAQVIVVIPVSLALALVRWDPLRRAPTSATGAGWTAPWSARPAALQPFAREQPAGRGGRIRPLLAVVVLLAPVVVIAVVVHSDRASTAPKHTAKATGLVYSAFAFRNAPWITQLSHDSGAIEADPTLIWRDADTDRPNVHVHDGVRLSFEPPRARLVIWFIGGSTMYGIGQRDLETIPSDVARLAERDGLPVSVVNLGVPAYSNWQETEQLSLLLANDEPPDMVVFYDGGNDVPDVVQRANQHVADLDLPGNHFEDDPQFSFGGFQPAPTVPVQPTDQAEIDGLVHVYSAGVDLARRLAASYGTASVFYWQPAAWSTDAPYDHRIWDAFNATQAYSVQLRTVDDGVRKRLPKGVVDLSTAMDGAAQPVFFDPVHTNELGAELVARAMWADLRPRVAALPDRHRPVDALLVPRPAT